jgi:hypothetical protein
VTMNLHLYSPAVDAESVVSRQVVESSRTNL